MGKILLTTFLFTGLLQKISSAAIPLETPCQSDAHCPDNFYCYEVSNICAACKPDFCSNINRENSYLKCHKEYSDCGKCLPGFEEEILTDGSPRAPCIRSFMTSAPSTDSAEIGPSNFTVPFMMGIVIASIVLVVGFVAFMKRKSSPAKPPPANDEIVPLNEKKKSSDKDENFLSPLTTTGLPVNINERPPPFNPSAPVGNDLHNSSNNEGQKTVITKIKVELHNSSGGGQQLASHEKKAPVNEMIEPSDNENILRAHTTGPVKITDNDLRLKTCERLVTANKLRNADYENEEIQSRVNEQNIPARTEPSIQVLPERPEEEGFNHSYYDEETQPSNWTPYQSPQVAEGGNSCSEAGEVPRKKKKLEDREEESEVPTESRPFRQFAKEDDE